MQIGQIKPKDFKEVSALIKKEFPYIGASTQKLESRLKSEGVFIFTAHEQNELAGFIDVSLSEGTGRLNGLSVKEKFRNLGIGKKLLEFAVGFMKESRAQKIMLLVKKENFAAKKMYEKAGFRFARVHPKKIDGDTVEEMELKNTKPLEKIFEKFVA